MNQYSGRPPGGGQGYPPQQGQQYGQQQRPFQGNGRPPQQGQGQYQGQGYPTQQQGQGYGPQQGQGGNYRGQPQGGGNYQPPNAAGDPYDGIENEVPGGGGPVVIPGRHVFEVGNVKLIQSRKQRSDMFIAELRTLESRDQWNNPGHPLDQQVSWIANFKYPSSKGNVRGFASAIYNLPLEAVDASLARALTSPLQPGRGVILYCDANLIPTGTRQPDGSQGQFNKCTFTHYGPPGSYAGPGNPGPRGLGPYIPASLQGPPGGPIGQPPPQQQGQGYGPPQQQGWNGPPPQQGQGYGPPQQGQGYGPPQQQGWGQPPPLDDSDIPF